jgi:hypothetical protein
VNEGAESHKQLWVQKREIITVTTVITVIRVTVVRICLSVLWYVSRPAIQNAKVQRKVHVLWCGLQLSNPGFGEHKTIPSSEFWCSVVWYGFTDVLEKNITSIFKSRRVSHANNQHKTSLNKISTSYFHLAWCLAHFSTLKMEAVIFSETWVIFIRLHGIQSQMLVL